MSQSVLIIDDEDHVRQMMRLALETSGYKVGEAKDGPEGLSVYGDGSAWKSAGFRRTVCRGGKSSRESPAPNSHDKVRIRNCWRCPAILSPRGSHMRSALLVVP